MLNVLSYTLMTLLFSQMTKKVILNTLKYCKNSVSTTLKSFFINVYLLLVNLDFWDSKFLLKPSIKKFSELTEFPQPNNTKSLCQFLRIANFYRNFSNIILPLTEWMLLNQKSNSITLTKEETKSFKNIKNCLSSVIALVFANSKVSNYQRVLIML